jgi:hypothetical protein
MDRRMCVFLSVSASGGTGVRTGGEWVGKDHDAGLAHINASSIGVNKCAMLDFKSKGGVTHPIVLCTIRWYTLRSGRRCARAYGKTVVSALEQAYDPQVNIRDSGPRSPDSRPRKFP